MIKSWPVTMIHVCLDDIRADQWDQKNYYFDTYQEGDDHAWSRLQASTDSFVSMEVSLQFFHNEFGGDQALLRQRCFFLHTSEQRYIGSAMAWCPDEPFDEEYGRLHWVVIDPAYRGLGLGKHLVIFTLQKLAQHYTKAYLTSQTSSHIAIKIYLDLGFRPVIDSEQDIQAWESLRGTLQHPMLDHLLL